VKLAIFGATGATGRQLVEISLEQGHTITALVRKPSEAKLPEAVTIVEGDIHDRGHVAEVIARSDAVLSCLGAALGVSRGPEGKVGTEAMPAILSAMAEHKVRRLIALSALGACEGKAQMSGPFKIIMATVLKGIYADKNAMEPLIRASDFDWTIVRPTNLKNGPRTGEIEVDPTGSIGILSTIRRADVADFMLKIVSDASYSKRVVTITHKR
jgi:putative NADH-flavin reductase